MGVFFSKRVGGWGTGLVQNGRTLVEMGSHPTFLRNSRTKNDGRRVRNVMEALQTPKTAIKKQHQGFWGKNSKVCWSSPWWCDFLETMLQTSKTDAECTNCRDQAIVLDLNRETKSSYIPEINTAGDPKQGKYGAPYRRKIGDRTGGGPP